MVGGTDIHRGLGCCALQQLPPINHGERFDFQTGLT